MSFSGLECYAMDKLQCGSADLSMLDNVYSTLGEDVYDTEDLVSETDDLNELLEKAYDQISMAETATGSRACRDRRARRQTRRTGEFCRGDERQIVDRVERD